MIWNQKLYVGKSIEGKEAKIKWKVQHNAGQCCIYILTFASNPQNLLDIIPAEELLQKAYPKEHLRVVGMARGYHEAIMLAGSIVEEVYRSTGTTKVREYLLQQENEKKEIQTRGYRREQEKRRVWRFWEWFSK